ncbi:MAG TPA: hypothetical protein VF244_04755 [Acidimicrobiales bacterium]
MILLLDARTGTTPRSEEPELRQRASVVVEDVYRLPDLDLGPFHALHISGMVDQEFLWQQRDVIDRFLDDGKLVVFCGHLLRPWLPGCGTFVPVAVTSYRDYVVHLADPHPVFDGVDPRDLTFRRGVAGFFARGHHPPPPGAEVLATLAGGQPITWIDRSTTNGTVFTHAGNDLIGFADDSTAARLGAQLLDWIEAETETATERSVPA